MERKPLRIVCLRMTDPSDEIMARALQAIREKRWPDAQRDLAAEVDRVRAEETSARLGTMLRNLGEVERKLGDVESARTHYEESVAILRNYGDTLTLAHTVRHLGDVYVELRRPDLARHCYDEALRLYRTHPEAAPLDRANAIRSMALLQHQTAEHAEARILWEQAREIYADLGTEAGVAECDVHLHQLNNSGRR